MWVRREAAVGAVPERMWAQSRRRRWGGHWEGAAVANPGADVDTQPLPVAKAHAHACVRASVRASACAPASVWLPFYPYIELASLLPLCECAHVHGGPCVSGSAYVRWRARAWATARACNSGDGRGVGRSRTAWEHGYVCWATPLQSDMSASAGSKLMLAGLLD